MRARLTLLDCEQILIFVNRLQTLYDAAEIHTCAVRCTFSCKKNTKLDPVFSVNETSHYNTNELLKTYTSQAQIHRLVDPRRMKRLPVVSSVQSQAGKSYARLRTDIIFVNRLQTLFDAAYIHVHRVRCMFSCKNTKLN